MRALVKAPRLYTMPAINYFKIYFSHRMLMVLFLGFASGLPFALTGATLQAWFTVAGIGVVSIGLLSMIGQPYVYKFIWAPFLDRYIPPIFGRRRGWIMILQLGLVIAIGWMGLEDPKVSPLLLAVLAIVVAFLSASQDIVIDAYRTEILKPEERGIGAAMAVGGYRVGALVSGGLALILADLYGWHFTYLLMAVFMALGIVATWFAPEPECPQGAPITLTDAVLQPLLELLSRERIIAILILVVIYKLGNAFALSLTTTFLLRDLHFTLVDIGVLYKVVGFAATVLGVFIGGTLMTRIGLYRALLIYGILQAVSNLLFIVLAMAGKNYAMLATTIFIENLCDGLGTAALLAFLMALCDLRFTATQFALLSALSALGRVFVGPLAGFIVQDFGWIVFYAWTVIIAIPGICMVLFLRSQITATTNLKSVSIDLPSFTVGSHVQNKQL